ncbi:MAG: hypothetical protein PWQ96_1981 [Clostridia bacterium]|jgi:hypothetical protein|nr:hypothetical protein [Clostridiales bacterium]MDK2986337.1 hypothetical protein [Clostridia bacterium]
MSSVEKLFVSGYARLPKGITAAELYRVVAIGLIVNKKTGEILDADCSLVTRSGETFVNELLRGCNLNDIDNVTEKLQSNYLGYAKKALIAALKVASKKYKNYVENNYQDTEDYA